MIDGEQELQATTEASLMDQTTFDLDMFKQRSGKMQWMLTNTLGGLIELLLSDYYTVPELVHELIETVAYGGNMLINVEQPVMDGSNHTLNNF